MDKYWNSSSYKNFFKGKAGKLKKGNLEIWLSRFYLPMHYSYLNQHQTNSLFKCYFQFGSIFFIQVSKLQQQTMPMWTLNMQRTSPCMLRKRPLDWEFGAPFHKSWPWKIIHLQRDCMGSQYPWSHKAPFKIYDVLLQQKILIWNPSNWPLWIDILNNPQSYWLRKHFHYTHFS